MNDNNATIELKKVTKEFKSTKVIDQLDLEVAAGEFLVLLGPSGCGKSTTLRMIAGLETASDGEVLIDGDDLKKKASDGHTIAMVFQDYALYPNMTVYQNLEYALKVHKVAKDERQKRLTSILETLNLSDYKDRLPSELSGGQKQRVALGRGMAKKSKIFLLDEPLSNIDVQLREKARDEIQSLHDKNKQTIVYVTHDQLEAMALGDRIAVMNDGIIQMIDTPENIYKNPTNLFVAKFIGTPQINVLPVTYKDNYLYLGEHKLVEISKSSKIQTQTNYLLGVRPEHIKVSKESGDGFVTEAEVTKVVDYGKFTQVTLKLTSTNIIKAVIKDLNCIIGDKVFIQVEEKTSIIFDIDSQKNIYWDRV
ncbi:ABC transporter ATP-binding protein [Companilactobacillus nodensis]|uniref:Glycerol-3-phosphate-transporting ATPase n=1 Tax=Companilactobacillus nodensis DSM 19682 = JCM 14932 = NBRC 107160 TaxID=1423775 RepID=A0A0R1KD30_9LACO|nr:ABC transporter ATP-binding protein [Companilactobacillus nodensis]KRK81324.1 glycerol-3-phosphate-transporting ATPase [Companilactobacillus nodensis DSM 19682 = JCM 14932 = NBRC 107160]